MKNIIEGINRGDQQSFSMLFGRYYKVLCSYVYNFIKDPVATDDLVQDLFIRLWDKRKDFDCMEKITSFLFVSARNACINLSRHEQMKKEKLKAYATEETDTESDHYWVMEEFDRKLNCWLESLPAECRKIMELSIDGRKNQEIAKLLNLSVNTVKNQKVKGYKILRDLYRDEYLILMLYLADTYL